MTNRSTSLRLLLPGLLCLVWTACASQGANPLDDSNWREGRVTRVAPGSELKNLAVRECVAPLDPEVIARSRFAVVRYWGGRWQNFRTVRLPTGSTIKADDAVRINVVDCSAPLVPTTGDSPRG